ncbi:MAG: hypothetical protein K6T91_10505 [Firmicutes bacterium]|nr:hypothetical protein [Bacillota bacterium]
MSLLIMPPFKEMLRRAGAVRANFRERVIVNMAGSLIIIVWLFLMAVAGIFPSIADKVGVSLPQSFLLGADVSIPLTLIILGAGIFGLVDDLLGSREYSGFKGHIGALLKGQLTTGALKAIAIPIAAVFAFSVTETNALEVVGNALLVALFVNTLNLLDLRPGRALKVYIPLQVIFLFAAANVLGSSAAVLAGIALALLIPDLREEMMLGDVGSNILGGILGFCFAITFGWSIKLAIIVILVLVQLLSEKYSISSIIERIAVLRVLDNLGRRAE